MNERKQLALPLAGPDVCATRLCPHCGRGYRHHGAYCSWRCKRDQLALRIERQNRSQRHQRRYQRIEETNNEHTERLDRCDR